ncbi:F0F1 ATP synthase subunit B [Patescibacteria group bacterium]|nr:F0F1 ATP synthase subunit B [Patescibacteria group bacterium]
MVEATSSPNVLSLFGLNGPLFAAQLVNFLIVVFVLYRWVYKPLLKTMDKRAEQIREGLMKAQAADSVLQEAQDRASRIVSESEQKAQALLEKTRVDAEAKRRKLLSELHEELDRHVVETKMQLQEERERMIQSAKEELGGIVVQATDAVTDRVLENKEQRTLLERAVKDVLS